MATLLKVKNWKHRNVHQKEDGQNVVSTYNGTLLSRRMNELQIHLNLDRCQKHGQ